MPGRLIKRHVAWPADHGTWTFFLTPLLIGISAGGHVSSLTAYLVAAALSGFLLRQPITILVKIVTGRRGRGDLSAAAFWSALYLTVAGLHLLGLVLRGFGFVLILALPGVIVFLWHLLLVARRGERGHKVVEILGAGVLALSAPATYWIGLGRTDPRGWLLWVLCWTFSTMSIVHVYARLAQRRPEDAGLQSLRRPARKALAVNSLLLVLVAITTSLANGSPLVPAAFLPQWVEGARASFARVPAPRPATIGVRQFAVSAIFTALFILFWQ